MDRKAIRDTLLSFFCKVEPDQIAKSLPLPSGIDKAEIDRLHRAAWAWDDPLIGLYASQNRYENAVHFYLAYHGQADQLPGAELVSAETDDEVYRLVRKHVFAAFESRVVMSTHLSKLLRYQKTESPEIIFLKKTLGDEFVRTVGKMTEESIMQPLVFEHLRKVFWQMKHIRKLQDYEAQMLVDGAYGGVVDALFTKMANGLRYSLDDEIRSEVEVAVQSKYHAMRSLAERLIDQLPDLQQEVMRLRYDMKQQKVRPAEEVARMLRMSNKTVLDLEHEIIRQLRPS